MEPPLDTRTELWCYAPSKVRPRGYELQILCDGVVCAKATQQDCPVACSEALGCVACNPGANVCSAGNVHQCTPAGEVGGEVTACAGATVCHAGACVDA